MTTNTPTRLQLEQVLEAEEKFRSHTFSSEDAREVLRYGCIVGSNILCHRSLPRAMEHARTHIREIEQRSGSVSSGTVILADTMTQTKGRFSRVWHAPHGGVWGCVIHADTLLDISRQFIPLAVGVACCEAVHGSGGSEATLRWVNDVLFGEKKVAGFLIEGFSSARYQESYNLIGFGINVNNSSFPPELATIATSLADVLGYELDLTRFTTLFLAKLAWNIGLIYLEEARYLHGGDYSGKDGNHLLLESWCNLSDTVGKRVVYGFDVIQSPQYEAKVVGIENDGGLRMRFADGTEKVEHSGEIRYL